MTANRAKDLNFKLSNIDREIKTIERKLNSVNRFKFTNNAMYFEAERYKKRLNNLLYQKGIVERQLRELNYK